MHMTTLEIAHSRTPSEIADLVAALRPAIPEITCFPATQHARSLASVAGVERGSGTPGESTNSRGKAARLVRPMVSYDLSAFALSFVPATSKQPVLSPPPVPIPVPAPASPSASPTTSLATTTVGPATASTPTGHGSNNDPDAYTYHHLRRDIYELASRAGASSGVTIASRYVVPSAHVTLGRYLTEADHGTPEARLAWVRKIEEVNDWLEREVWDGGSGSGDGEWIGEWIVGQEKGLDARCGALWYGGGRTIMLGEGF